MIKPTHLWTLLREGFADHLELQERLALCNRPWAEEFLHWQWTEQGWQLHGRLMPPRGRPYFSVTRSGWCQRAPKWTACSSSQSCQ